MTNAVAVLLSALSADPLDTTAWQALADALEEDGQPLRAELTRCSVLMRRDAATAGEPVSAQAESRLQELLGSGVKPCVPELTNSLGMRFVVIPPGRFQMGSPAEEEERSEDEQQHEVEITKPMWLGVYPVTQGEYRKVTRKKPSRFKGDNLPVEQVSWDDAVAFCQKLSERAEEKEAGRKYRLPSEAEWEYSCRGGLGSSQPFHFGTSISSTQANFDGNDPYGGAAKGPYQEQTTPVGSYAPNGWGLYDMHGNVWEWCSDWYGGEYYKESPREDPTGPSEGSFRVNRGGSWYNNGRLCRSACRDGNGPTDRGSGLGFRVSLVPSGASKGPSEA